ncbi:DUF6303 family protein [Streptomyces luteogriseus]|uniref:DUF6303 family protein n=1 Tax=Streptomyces luteogriseus TaxID=68233 RepID=UPI0037AF8636
MSRYWAFLHWTADRRPTAGWTLRVVDEEGEVSALRCSWDGPSQPPPLLTRYDALATLGFAVREGGTEAWEWREYTDDEGTTYFLGRTEIRQLRAEEVERGVFEDAASSGG